MGKHTYAVARLQAVGAMGSSRCEGLFALAGPPRPMPGLVGPSGRWATAARSRQSRATGSHTRIGPVSRLAQAKYGMAVIVVGSPAGVSVLAIAA